jgi:WD40 repeat protein
VAEWNIHTAETQAFGIRTDATIYSLLNIDQKTLLIGTNHGSIHVIDLATKREVRHLKLHDQGIFHMVYVPNLHRVYAASADGSVSVWEADEWSLLWHLELNHGKVRRIALTTDGGRAAFACGDGSVKVIETRDNKLLYSIEAHEGGASAAAFLANGDLITGGKDAHLKRWNQAYSYGLIKSIPAHNYAIYDIVVHPSGRWLATASRDKTVKIWEPELEGKPLRLDRKAHGGHLYSVNGLLYLPDEDLLASVSDDRTVGLWKVS